MQTPNTYEHSHLCVSEHVVPHDGRDGRVVVFDVLGHVLDVLEEELLGGQAVVSLSLLALVADAQVVHLEQHLCNVNSGFIQVYKFKKSITFP